MEGKPGKCYGHILADGGETRKMLWTYTHRWRGNPENAMDIYSQMEGKPEKCFYSKIIKKI
jgi:hypothetical protein